MPRASAAEAEETARRILASALRRFTADDYAQTSIDDIARDAGVTRGAVYHHYADKRGLLRAVVEDRHARIAALLVEQAEHSADPFEQLRAGSHAFVDAITSDDAARLLLVEAPAVLGWSTWRDIDATASVRELRDAVTAVAPGEDAEATTQLLSGAMNEAALWLIERPTDDARRRSVHRALDRLLEAVTGC